MVETARNPVLQLIVDITAAINARALYGSAHPTYETAVRRVTSSLDTACRNNQAEQITFLVVGDELLVNEHTMRQDQLFQRQFLQNLRRRGIERLTLVRGLEMAECASWIDSLVEAAVPQGSDKIIVGRVELGFQEGRDAAGDTDSELTSEQIERAKDAFTQFRKHKQVAIGEFKGVVSGLMSAIARSSRTVLPLAALKDHDEYTFIHSINVALLVLGFARWFGLDRSTTHALGLAALLHDIGKLTVPLAVLNKPGKLEGDEWIVMQSHAEQGAWYLASSEETPALAVVVAYEHHLRYDGEPNYPLLRVPRRASLASAMTSIADTFDAVRTTRPYQSSRPQSMSLEILRKRAGTFHDPLLVANFQMMIEAQQTSDQSDMSD